MYWRTDGESFFVELPGPTDEASQTPLHKLTPAGPARAARPPELADLVLPRRGNRLSITPVDEPHWKRVVRLLEHDVR